MQRICLLAILAAASLTTVGCGVDQSSQYLSGIRKENGLVIILPGIEGESGFNHNIRTGLAAAGCFRAMPIYNWGLPIPGLGLLVNQSNVIGNRIAGSNIAKMVEKYQDAYPGRPVFLVGHSGGGGVAVFAAEGMSKGRQLDGLILLSASISADYNLTKAMSRCKNGIVNFYNRDDAGLLGVGTAIVGNVDGGHGASAGLTGFSKQYGKLHQVQVTKSMTFSSGGGTHDAATRPGFVSRYVAPWVLSSVWPPNMSLTSLDVQITQKNTKP